MIHCLKCNCTPMDKPFVRMNSLGEIGVFWCETCCKQFEPEFYKNEKEEEPQIFKDLKEVCYGK